MRHPITQVLFELVLALVVVLAPASARAGEGGVFKLDCTKVDCKGVLPGAARFEKPKTQAKYRIGYDAAGKLVGWVVLSTDVVDVKAYSGKPLVTLVGLTPKGVISGAKVIHHSEPILLVGIPESALFKFVDFYKGKSATAKIVVGSTDEPDTISVDVISGATVTSLAQNRTILDTARTLGAAVGVVKMAQAVPGHFVREDKPWTWQRMLDEKVLGHLTVTQEQMGLSGDDPFIDIYFAIADPPQIGKALLGTHEYEWKMKQLEPGEHILVVLGNGTSSFKGSGFVRGGIFDRIRVEQGLRSVTFHDHDFENLSGVAADDAPRFKEGAIFTLRKGRLDLGAAFDVVFLGSHYDFKRGAFQRDFKGFRTSFRMPKSEYVLDGPDPNAAIWHSAWHHSRDKSIFLGVYLLLIAAVFAGRRWSTGSMKRLQLLHKVALVASFLLLGVWLRAQPSVTQVLTFVGSLVGHLRWSLFLSEPVIFISWIFIAVVTLVWGRGVFCGWVCPYGALNELVFRLGRLVRLPTIELPDRFHNKLRWVRYGVLVLLVGTFLYSSELGEKLAEVEPFKSTFFVLPWTRQVGFFAWWALLIGLSLVWYRPFCRYLCPLGAALALPSSLRASGPYRRNFCTSCKICTRGCEPRAIRSDGVIDSRECLSCMECEANYRDEEVCPPLIGIERLTRKAKEERTAHDEEHLERLRRDAEDRKRRKVA